MRAMSRIASEPEVGLRGGSARLLWLVRSLLILGFVGILAGGSGGWGIWAGACFIAGGAIGTFAPGHVLARSGGLTRRVTGDGMYVLLNRVGGIGFIVIGVGVLIAAIV
jgi:hypothetical protein